MAEAFGYRQHSVIKGRLREAKPLTAFRQRTRREVGHVLTLKGHSRFEAIKVGYATHGGRRVLRRMRRARDDEFGALG